MTSARSNREGSKWTPQQAPPGGPSGEYDCLVKLLALGDSGVGKTSILMRYVNNTFSTNVGTTVGIDFFEKKVTVGNQRLNLQLWDTSGQERYHAVTSAFYRDVYGFLLVFDLTNEDSFMNVRTWLQQLRDQAQPEPHDIILVGNKSDLKDSAGAYIINSAKIEQLASELHLDYVETSAKTGRNVKLAFEKLIQGVTVTMEHKLKLGMEQTFPPEASSGSRCYC